MAEADFSDLVSEAEQLAAEFEGTGDLPKVERSLKQILEASQSLWSRVTVTGAQDIQANLLLGTKGLDLPQVTQKLQTLSSRKTFEPLDPIPVTDIQNFLKNESENAILQLIESTHRKTLGSIEKLHFSKLFEEWENHKTNLMNSLQGYSKEIVDVPVRRERTALSETLFGLQSSLDQEEMSYAQCLMDYNNVDIQGLTEQNLLKNFADCIEKFNNTKVNEMWKMLRYMSELRPIGKGDVILARVSPKVQKKMIQQALAYLEQRYKEHMVRVVDVNLNTAKRGGVPGTFHLVKGYVNIKIQPNEVGLEEKTKDVDLPLWPRVYYSLRCGDIPAAIQTLKQSIKPQPEMIAVLEELEKSPERRLKVETEMQVRGIYRRMVRSSPDQYKRIVYCVLGACDVHDDHKVVATTADDYLWLKLLQVREEEADAVPDRIYFSLLQTLVLDEYGESYYKANEQPHVFFQVLVLTGQWESAIDFLIRLEKYKAHGVHMAIALHELDLLALPASINSPLLVIDQGDKSPMRRLNLARLVLMYTRKFESTDPKETLHYFYILRKITGTNDTNAFVTCIINHIIENRNYELILGKIEGEKGLVPGLLNIFKGKVDEHEIIQKVAHITESKGLLEEAVKLYDLCGAHEKVLDLLNGLLSQVVSKHGATRTRLSNLAVEVAKRYSGLRLNCTASSLTTYNILQDLFEFFDMYQSKQYQKALEIIQKCQLIPMSVDELEARVNNFRLLDECITRNMPDILLATMHIYQNQYQQARGDTSTCKLEDTAKTKQLSFIRDRARLLTSFAGTIPYRMPGDTNSRLVHIEITMN